ncbi:MAG: hypothetical protein ACJ8CG_09735, partial [Microvirga sp.]
SFETPLAAASQDGTVSESADRWTTFGPDILHVITGAVLVIPIGTALRLTASGWPAQGRL